MGGRRQLIIAALIVILGSGGLLGYSYMEQQANMNYFPESGYILTGDPEIEMKQLLFTGGTTWRNGLDETVAFDDLQGNKTEVSSKSFVHYESESLAALSDGVVVDLNDISSARMTNHYAVSSKIVFQSAGPQGYTPSNSSSDLQLTDFLWKVSEDKYMIVSDDISVRFSEEDVRDTSDFVEVTYIDGGVIQLQTAENLWQTVSNECVATLDNGESLDLSLKNIQDGDGNVLMDFGKIALNSDDYTEVIPLTEELKNVHESVIPHFDITAEQGQDGEIGLNGENGLNGTNGTQGRSGSDGNEGQAGLMGEDGAAGGNGAAGASGTNGAAGAPGAPGAPGTDGGSAQIEGEVLQFPVFTLATGSATPTDVSAWKVTSTGCEGNIMVTDEGNYLRGETLAGETEQVYLIDVSSGKKITNASNSGYNFYQLGAANSGYPFSFTGLTPDHCYRLVVVAPVQTSNTSSAYLRTFIDKTFWTDSTGYYMEAAGSTTTKVTAQVYKQSYASADSQVYISFFDSESAASAVTLTSSVVWNTVNVDAGSSAKVTYPSSGALQSNTTYYARLKARVGEQDVLLAQIQPLTTLKETASLGAPTLSSNRDSWGFDLTPGSVYDKDHGITGYVYEFYAEGSVNADSKTLTDNATPIRTVAASSADSIVVPMDGTALIAGRSYYVRTVATFNDNEKTFEITSPLSNMAQITGSQRPAVYYTNLSGGTGSQTTSTNDSDNYDVIAGTVHIDPGTTGSRMLLDATHTGTLTIRASGYYYVQYQVINKDAKPTSYNNDALEATVNASGYVTIPLKMRQLTDAGLLAEGDAAGLRPNTYYNLIVSGHLTEDGTTSTGYDQTIGTVVVKTQDTTAMQATWTTTSATTGGDPLRNLTFSLSRYAGSTSAIEEQIFNEELQTLSHLTITLYTGSLTSVNPTKLGEIEVTNNYADTVNNTKLLGLRSTDSEAAQDTTLGNIVKNGMTLEIGDFGLEAANINTLSAVHVELSEVYDYTYYADNRANQTAYVYSDADDTTAPDSNDFRYRMEFTVNNYAFEIELTGQPDKIPDAQSGFDLMRLYTWAKDRNASAYNMHANYANGAKLATYITYYVFDAPDFYHDYSNDNNWEVDTVLYPSTASRVGTATLKTPVTVKDSSGKHPWLGAITIPLSTGSSTIPGVNFIGMTQVRANLGNPANRNATPQEGGIRTGNYGTDNQGRYYLFFDEDCEEPSNGHQYVFAWTLQYRMDANPDEVLYYPFDVGGTDGYTGQFSIPHSSRLDRPLSLPTVYALPWSLQAGEEHEAKWYLYVYDPEGAVVRNGTDGKANLYRKTGGTTDVQIRNGSGNPVPVTVHGTDLTTVTVANLISIDNLVTIPYGANWTSNEITKIPVALRLQRYTDKYVVSTGTTGTTYTASAFPTGTNSPSANDYSPAKRSLYDGNYTYYQYYWGNNTNTPSCNMTGTARTNWDADLFSYTIESTGGYAAPSATVNVEPKGITGSSKVRELEVTVSSDTNLNRINAVRLTFTKVGDTSKRIVLTKPLIPGTADNMTTVRDNDGNITGMTFRIIIGQELVSTVNNVTTDLSNTNVKIDAELLYETGVMGWQHVIVPENYNNPFALAAYTPTAVNNNRLEFTPQSDRYYFSSSSAISRIGSNSEWPRLGSFFGLSVDQHVASGALTVTNAQTGSARSWSFTEDLNLLGEWGANASGTLPAMERRLPHELGAQASDTIESFDVPAVTKVIEYSGDDVNVNSFSVNYDVGTAGTTLWFTLEEVTSSGSTNGTFMSGKESDPLHFTTTEGANIEQKPIPNTSGGSINRWAIRVTSGANGTGTVNFSNLPVKSEGGHYVVKCWYEEGAGHVVTRLDERDAASGKLRDNYRSFDTWSKPNVSLTARYVSNNYANKYVIHTLSVTRVVNFWYATELQKLNGDGTTWEPVTYLEAERGTVANVPHYVTARGDITWASGSTLYKSTGFSTDGNGGAALTFDPNVPVVLEYDATYRVVSYVYDLNTGPAYNGDKNAAMDTTESASFTIPYSRTVLTPESSLANNVLSFTVHGFRNGSTLEGDAYAVQIIRSKANEGDTDVTDSFDAGSGTITGVLGFATSRSMTRDMTNDDLNATYTLYIYGKHTPAPGGTENSTTRANQTPTRNDLLEGETLTGGQYTPGTNLILLVRVSPRRLLDRSMREMLEDTAKQIGSRVFESAIRELVAVREAEAERQSIFAYAPRSKQTKDYEKFLNEYLELEHRGVWRLRRGE